jgi:large subunit ribosomal protein L35
MSKQKTHKGAAKRLKVTGSGKVVRYHAAKRHILTKKTRKRKRKLRHDAVVSPADMGRVRRMLGIGPGG